VSTGRDPIEDHVIAAATLTGQPFETMACDPDLADTAAFCAAYGIAVEDSANTIVVATKEEPARYVACVVLATHRLDVNGVVRKRLGARKVSFAPADVTAAVTGMVMGGVTPFGLPDGIPVWVDAAVMARERIVTGGGSRAMKLLHPPATLAAVATVEIVEGLARLIEVAESAE
jgi:prolyl-tRNA editing enzyme YbaK/EbsC (Cys-tRNA(Pro) deacylase)